jgi:hypothetical protein
MVSEDDDNDGPTGFCVVCSVQRTDALDIEKVSIPVSHRGCPAQLRPYLVIFPNLAVQALRTMFLLFGFLSSVMEECSKEKLMVL